MEQREDRELQITLLHKAINDTDKIGIEVFTTLDAWLAGHLVDRGYKYQLVSENGGQKYSFHFPVADGLLQAVYEYQKGLALVNVLQFSRTVKALRGEILRRRSTENDGFTRATYHK